MNERDKAEVKAAVEANEEWPRYTVDEWDNVVSGLGRLATDKRISGEPAPPRNANDRQRWDRIFHADGLTARIAELLPFDETREWIEVRIEASEESKGEDQRTEDPTMDLEERTKIERAVMKKLDEIGAQQAVFEARLWARNFGGSLMLLGVDDGGGDNPESMKEPLNIKGIKSFTHLTVFDRFEWHPATWYDDIRDPKFGLPRTYRMGERNVPGGVAAQGAASDEVHETRFIRFDGNTTSRRRRVNNNGWHDPIWVRLYAIVRDFAQAWGGVAGMLQDFRVAVWKMKGLADALKAGDRDAVIERFRIMNLCISVSNAVPLDADNEDYEKKSTNLSGLPDTLDRFAEQLSAQTGYPISILFGRAPAGLSATGEKDIVQYYDMVKASQNIHVRKPLEQIIDLIFLIPDGPTRGVIPENWNFKFNELWQLDAKADSERRLNMAKADKLYIDSGSLSKEEVAESRWGGSEYSIETMLDVKERARLTDEALKDPEPEPVLPELPTEPVPPLNEDQVEPVRGTFEPIDHRHTDPEGGQTGGLIALSGEFEGMHTHERPEGRGQTEASETGKEHVHTTPDGNTGPNFNVFREDRVKKVGTKYQVTNRSGTKVLGTHKTREGAEAQLAAIEISKRRRDNFRRRGPRDWVVLSNEGGVIGRHTTRTGAKSQIEHIVESQGVIVERLSASEWIVVNAEGDILAVHETRKAAGAEVNEILGRTDSEDPCIAPNEKPVAYYAHPMGTYGSDEEASDIAEIQSQGYEVINPNDPALAESEGMEPFLELVRGADVVFSRGETSGVNYEVHEAEKHDIPVIEMHEDASHPTTRTPDFCKTSSANYSAARCKRWRAARSKRTQ